ncbi:MAG: hypothetical protein V7731_08350 [Amphritea sp.]
MLDGTSIFTHKIKPDLFASDGPSKRLAESSYQLPVCWMLLFQQDDLQLQKVYTSEGEEACQYTTLICTKDQALERYAPRAERFKRLLGPRCDTYFDYWHQYILHNADAYLHLDATALWMVGDEQAYLDNLLLCLSGIEWLMSDEARWQRSWLESIPLIGHLFDPANEALRHKGLKHLLMQSGVLDAHGGIYIDKVVLQGNI